MSITLFGRRRPVYVETLIRAPLDDVWDRTQSPRSHERWDLRFSSIDYLPRPDADGPQRFTYATRIAPGLRVAGVGETGGERDLPDGSRTSALRFGSASRLSLIREGSGYWKYLPTPDGVRFLTWYDYSTRYGLIGAVIDRAIFRPLIGWATAWSFDRLRRWLEDGLDPAIAFRQAVVHGVARVTLAAIFAYHGLVPKLLGPHPDELAMFAAAGVPTVDAALAARTLGVAEVLFAGLILMAWRQRWVPVGCIAFAVVATLIVAATSPAHLGAPFNPVTLNLGVASLALIDRLTIADTPTAASARRRPTEVPR